MLRAAILLLILTNAAWRPREFNCDYLEANHLPSGNIQLIAWQSRGTNPWPLDWTMTPCGKWDGKRWWDANGAIVEPYEAIETWTDHDPERRAFNYWREMGEKSAQGGAWHEVKAPFPALLER